MKGHVFVVRGDLTKLSCDAWMLPTDRWFNVTPSFDHAVPVVHGRLPDQEDWRPGERVRRFAPDGGSTGDPQVWLGDIGTGSPQIEWYVDGVEAFVRAAAPSCRSQPGRPPLLAINHVGTGFGGAAFTKGELLTALFRRLYELVDDLVVDVVVVSFDAKAYAAAQRARMRALGGSGPDALDAATDRWEFESAERGERLRVSARALARSVDDRRLAVFMGAGVSAGAGLPGWGELITRLGASLDPPLGRSDLDRLRDDRDRAALLEKRFKEAGRSLGTELGTHLGHARYSLQHGLLASMAIDEVTTTNFDELFEAAATTGGRALTVIPGNTIDGGGRWLLKLHGTLSEPDTLVFTRAAYLDAPRQRGALFGLVQAMLMTRHMLFVGYGLADEDFHDLVHEVRYAQPADRRTNPLGTALTLFDDPIRDELWKGDLEVVAMRADQAGGAAGAGRDVERFLDLVGMRAADRSAFILDPEYAGMLTESEHHLADLVGPLAAAIGLADERDGWRSVAEVLERLGAR